MNRATYIFILINLFFSCYYIDSWTNANTTSRVLPVLSVVDQGTMKIDSFADKTIDKSFVNGHYYSDKAPLPSFLIIPFYAGLKAMGLSNQGKDFYSYSKPVFILGDLLCGSFPFVIICLLFFLYTSKYTDRNRAAILSMIFLYCSFIFVFSGTLFTHVLSAGLLLLSYIFIKEKKNYFYSGLFLGLAILSDYSVCFIAVIWALQLFLNERKTKDVISFLMGLVPLILLLMVYNIATTGSAFDLLYNHDSQEGFAKTENLGFSYPHINALWGLTLSPYRGILFYCSFLVLPLIILLKEKVRFKIDWSKNYLLLITIGYFLLISSHKVWWGGWSFGPRQLMPIAVLLLFESVVYISKRKVNDYLFWSLSLVSLIFIWIVKSTVVYSVPTEIKNPIKDYFFQNIHNGATNPNNLLTMIYGVQPWTAAFVWLFLFVFVLICYGFKQNKRIGAKV